MPVLRISQQPGSGPNRYQIAVNAEVPGVQPLSFSREIDFALSAQDGGRIRWYLEDYLQFAHPPAPRIAAGVETLMADRGEALFRAIFEGQNGATRLWAMVAPHLSSTRIEIVTGIAEASSIPWELMRDPHAGVDLALSAEAFVRSQPGAQPALASSQTGGKVRILLAICRPRGGEDVPFRSVANRLVKELSDADRDAFQLDVLRPPTYEQLAKVLRLAREKGEPYHIVHFDGHGVYADPKDVGDAGRTFSNLMLKGGESGPRGYLCFEDPDSGSRNKLVDGFTIGGLLRDAGVPILILNACQSAFADAKPQPEQEAPEATRQEIMAYGSLAQAVVNTGASGVVAMRYAVYVVTAAQFVAGLYAALARGRTLGEAVAWARRDLADQPNRAVAYAARPLRDWVVPVVWERMPLRLWPQRPEGAPLALGGSESTTGRIDPKLPQPPDVGFFGRDETLYALDRAFDRHRIVLLHAFAGSGKTTTAAEFARWYALTGGVQGWVLFTSFERHLPLARVLDKIGELFGPALERAGVLWGAANDARRREIALDVMRQIPVLWIWDNVEPVTGFPAGTPSDWNAAEQRELKDFLLEACDTKAKILLTSRRDERAWLGEMPCRVKTPPMPEQECLQLAGAIVERRGRRLVDLPDLAPLLRFTQGNPLTILVTIRMALRAGIDSPARLDAFVAGLRAGEANFDDEETEGRSTSLGASLSYGFANAFTEDERQRLALLHLFQGFVNVDVLRTMGHPAADWALEDLRGMTREEGIGLLDRAAELGLLVALGSGFYSVHPALPWYFRALFARHFADDKAEWARRAFVEALGGLGSSCHDQYGTGDSAVLHALMWEEDNLLAAWNLARRNKWWPRVISTMQGLRTLYGETGRLPAWRRLVEAVTPNFVDPRTGQPLPGREEQWILFAGYRVRLATQDRNLAEAERLHRLTVDWDRERARAALATRPEERGDTERHAIRTLAVATHEFADIQRDGKNPACIDSYREALGLAQAIADTVLQAICAFNLGIAYTAVAAVRDLDAAERWLRQSLDWLPPGDASGRGKVLAELGQLFLVRFDDALEEGRSEDELLIFLNQAAQNYHQSLKLMLATSIGDLSVLHSQLGLIYGRAGDIDRAQYHYQQGIRYIEQAGDIFRAGQVRENFARILLQAGRFDNASAYAVEALTNFRAFGERAKAEVQMAEQLIADIDELASEQQAQP